MSTKCVIHDTIHEHGICPGLKEKPVGFGIREDLRTGRWYLTRDGIGISHYKLTSDREEAQRWADALNASDAKAEADKAAKAEQAEAVVSISSLPDNLDTEAAHEFAVRLFGKVALVGHDPSRGERACSVGFSSGGGIEWVGYGPTFKAAFLDAEQYL